MLKISIDLIKSIKEYGELEYPNECCGIILGNFSEQGKNAQELIGVSNARDEANRHNRFLITPKEMLKAEIYAHKKGLDVIGFYHSHPDHPSKPSQYDLDHAWPRYSYIIVSVDKAISQIVSSWELEDNRLKFNNEVLEII